VLREGNSPVVLVIDDADGIRDIIRRLLQRRNYKTLTAKNGAMGLEVFYREKPDLLIVDLRMEGIDGLEVLKEVKKNSPDSPVIVMSGSGVITDAIEALRLGAWDYLFKPIREPSVLYHSVEKALERSRLLRENREYQERLQEEVDRRTVELEVANQALRESEEQYRLLVENQEDLVVKFKPDGRLLFVSPSYCRTFGKTQEELLGKKFMPLVHQEDREKVARAIENVFNPPYSSYVEERTLTKNGRRWQAWLNTAILDENRKVKEVLAVGRDITERKNAEEERQKLEMRLYQAQKMEAVGNLAGSIAHDFNNLLTVINGYAEVALMKMGEEKKHPLRKDISAVLQAGRQAENLTKQLLAFSRKQIFEPKIIDINRVISNLDKMMRRLICEDIHMDIRFGTDIPKIKADPGQIEQILMNLIVNAKDALMNGTNRSDEKRITIETGQAYLDEDFVAEHAGSRTGSHLFFSVSDNGMGMSEEVKSKIFEPFFTTKGKGKGTGLGMATVYGIVKQNNGCIYVYSEPGQGTTFKVYWPSTEGKETPEILETSDHEALTGSETILLAEDDEEVRHLAAESLGHLGYHVLEAADGKEALELLKKKKRQVDLLFTDLVMPGMGGWELAGKLNGLFPGTAVLYTSGHTEAHIIRDGALEEGVHFLHKPYSVHEMAAKVRQVLDGR
jgi:PAS domain S-box-containing protein